MIRSMTGFGSASGECQGHQCRLEIKTLNNRFKEFVVRSPHQLFPIEEPVKKLISSKVQRGRVELWIVLEPRSGAAGMTLDLEVAREAKRLLESLRRELDLEGPVTLEHLLRLGVIAVDKATEPADSGPSGRACWD